MFNLSNYSSLLILVCPKTSKLYYPLLDQSTHFALAFELPGGWHKEKEAMTLTVLQVFIVNSLQFHVLIHTYVYISRSFLLCIFISSEALTS